MLGHSDSVSGIPIAGPAGGLGSNVAHKGGLKMEARILRIRGFHESKQCNARVCSRLIFLERQWNSIFEKLEHVLKKMYLYL